MIDSLQFAQIQDSKGHWHSCEKRQRKAIKAPAKTHTIRECKKKKIFTITYCTVNYFKFKYSFTIAV